MKLIKTHIIFLLTVIGLLTATVETAHLLKPTSFLIESEIEEILDGEIESCDVWEDNSIQKLSKDGNATFTCVQSFFGNVHFDFTILSQPKNKPLSNKVAYFILYCCLKVNC